MITAAFVRSSLRQAWVPLALGAAIIVLTAGGEWARRWLAYDREAIAHGQLWRLLSNALVHLGTYHAALNLLGLATLVLLCGNPRPVEWLRRLLLLSLGVSVGLYLFVPWLDHYVGLSGTLHGLFLLGLWPMARRGDRLAGLCLVYLLGKVGWETATGIPLANAQRLGGQVVTSAHLLGTLAGLAYGLLVKPCGNQIGTGDKIT